MFTVAGALPQIWTLALGVQEAYKPGGMQRWHIGLVARSLMLTYFYTLYLNLLYLCNISVSNADYFKDIQL